MTAPLVDRSTGDIIPAADHNDVKDYIEDGTYRINTKSLNIQGVGEVINTMGFVLGMVPIGGVVAWLKGFAEALISLPAQFVECNGQTLSDADSPYN